MRRHKKILVQILSIFHALAFSALLSDAADAPVAKRVAHPTELPDSHCDHPPCRREDDYFWLRSQPGAGEPFPEDIVSHLEQENAYTDAKSAEWSTLKDEVQKEVSARANANLLLDAPYSLRGYLYYKKLDPGQKYPAFWRKDEKTGKEELLLDTPKLAADSKYFNLYFGSVSPDGRYLTYAIDRFGKRSYALYLKALDSGEVRVIREKDVKVGGTDWQIVWSANSQFLFYSVPGTLSRDSRVVRFDLHETSSEIAETTVYDELDGAFYLFARSTASGKYLVLLSKGNDCSQVRVIPTIDPKAEPLLLSPKKPGHKYFVDHVGDQFVIVSNLRGKDRELYVAPEKTPTIENWKPLFSKPLMTDVTHLASFERHLVVIGVEKAFQRAKIISLPSRKTRDIPMPDRIFAVSLGKNADPSSPTFRFQYASLTSPLSLREVDLETGEVKVLAEKKYPGHDPSRYEVEHVWTKSFDGTLVPSDVIFKKGTPKDGKSPLWISAYGNYGLSLIGTWLFDQDRISLLDRGITVVLTYPRGGGELGYDWGVAGSLRNKITSFKDVIAVAKDLADKGYAHKDRMALEGESAAGLVTGYIANTEPNLFKAIVQRVPFVDLLNTMSDPTIPMTTQEYAVWGNPADPEDYRYMASYSPYDNISRHDYPAMLVMSALGDSQVPYWEPAKWVARLRANKTDQNPLLLRMDMVGGHRGSSDLERKLANEALRWSFVIHQIGVRDSGPPLSQ